MGCESTRCKTGSGIAAVAQNGQSLPQQRTDGSGIVQRAQHAGYNILSSAETGMRTGNQKNA